MVANQRRKMLKCSTIPHRRLACGDWMSSLLIFASSSSPPPPQWGTHGPGGIRSPYFFPWHAGHPCLTLRATSLSLPGDPANIGKGSRPARCTRARGLGSNPRESGSVIGADRTVWALLCVAETRATRPNGEWGYSTRLHMLGPERPSDS